MLYMKFLSFHKLHGRAFFFPVVLRKMALRSGSIQWTPHRQPPFVRGE